MWFDTLTKVWGRKIILLFIFMGVLPLSAFGAGGADFDDSLIVDFNDLKLFTDYWLYDYNDNRQCASWDLAINGQIDFYDLDVFANLWLTEYDFGDFSGFGRYWRKTVDYRFEDARFDLNGNGFVDWRDFSAFAVDWGTWINPCEDTNVAGPWQRVDFTGIGGCASTTCIEFGDDYSDFVWDNCANYLFMVCTMTEEYGWYCAYNFYFNGQFIGNRVGLCIYTCGINGFQVKKNASESRILQTRHRTQDRLFPYGCDAGTQGYYDWQVVVYNCLTGQRTGYCRETVLDPDEYDIWEEYEGMMSSCENAWWE
jgi:hypothetical protein